MKIIDQSHEFLPPFPEDATIAIEVAARTCYKSERLINADEHSDEILCEKLVRNDHTAMLEFADITVRFVTDRGVTHELVRHRVCSFAQESTRYVAYKGDMEFIRPVWFKECQIDGAVNKSTIWLDACEQSERAYHAMMDCGASPQEARQVLNNSVKTEICMKANIREWRHIFKLRTSKAAHPQMRALMISLLDELKERLPVLFSDIDPK